MKFLLTRKISKYVISAGRTRVRATRPGRIKSGTRGGVAPRAHTSGCALRDPIKPHGPRGGAKSYEVRSVFIGRLLYDR